MLPPAEHEDMYEALRSIEMIRDAELPGQAATMPEASNLLQLADSLRRTHLPLPQVLARRQKWLLLRTSLATHQDLLAFSRIKLRIPP